MDNENGIRRIATVVFPDFELLDVSGPLEIFGSLPERFELCLIGPDAGPVRSTQGPRVVADYAYRDAPPPDVVLVPGGRGTRLLVGDEAFLDWIASWASPAAILASVCTGSGVLAKAGLLDGYNATSNKRAFAWACEQSSRVTWIRQARWVEDRNRWTSSGVAAGMDMALALIEHLSGNEVAQMVADNIELERHRDASWDPYAALHG